ncbi:MAG TPA: MMPL family transporter [Polyangiaceae bacterium]|nr:MMPL family transporter [Polyangiaceae bacterium]
MAEASSSSSSVKSALARLLERLGSVQTRRPFLVLLLLLCTLVPATFLTLRLGVRESFSELLPEDKPSVIEMRRIEKRLSSRSTLIVVIEGGDTARLKSFVDLLAPRLRAELDPALVSSVETGTREVQQFFEQNKHLYVSLERLRELHGDVVSAYDSAVARASGLDLGLDDEEVEEPEQPAFDFSLTEQKLRAEADAARKRQPGQGGYYIGSEPLLAAVLVRTPLGSTDPRAFELRAQIENIVARLKPQSPGPPLRVGYTGNLITSAEQRAAVLKDLQEVGVWGVSLILGITLLFFMRLRVVVIMALTVGTGALWTFGLVRLLVGHLNSATGFLVSIIVGNGINFGIIYMARYIEARRDEKLGVADAVAVAHRETHAGTLAAAAAAMIAYGSLSATDFRGFRHFGVIGGLGMILCWAATYVTLPPLLVLSERAKPLFVNEAPWRARLRGVYGYPFAWLATRAPRTVVALGLSLGVV